MALDEQPTHVDAATGDGAQERVTPDLVQVSRAMVRIYKEQFGRGPERVRSHYAGADAIVSFLEGTLTPVERTLTTIDEHQRLREMRMLFQYAAEEEFRRSVEEITGRKVTAFVSGFDTRADLATEVFALEPRVLDGGSARQ
jgi:uncharacterized protein YbcI